MSSGRTESGLLRPLHAKPFQLLLLKVVQTHILPRLSHHYVETFLLAAILAFGQQS